MAGGRIRIWVMERTQECGSIDVFPMLASDMGIKVLELVTHLDNEHCQCYVNQHPLASCPANGKLSAR